MKILNPDVQKDLDAGTPININLGSGMRPKEGYYSLDHVELEGIDMVADLNEPLSALPDNSVGRIHSRHVLEHVKELLPLLRELHRVTGPEGVIDIRVPHFSNPYFYSDPTHVNFFGLYTMNYFVASEDQPKTRRVPAFYTDMRFKLENTEIRFYRKGIIDKIIGGILVRIINQSFWLQDFYERRLCRMHPASEIRYLLRPVK